MLVLLLAILGSASPAGAQVTQVPAARVRGPRLAPLFSERRAPRLPFAPALYGRGVENLYRINDVAIPDLGSITRGDEVYFFGPL